ANASTTRGRTKETQKTVTGLARSRRAAPNSPLKGRGGSMMGTALGIGSSQLGQPNPWGASPYGGHAIGPQLFTQPPYTQPLQPMSFAGYGAGNNPFGTQTATAPYAQPLQQIQQLLHILPVQVQQLQQLQQHQHILQQQQLHQLQQLLQLVPQQLNQLQQLV